MWGSQSRITQGFFFYYKIYCGQCLKKMWVIKMVMDGKKGSRHLWSSMCVHHPAPYSILFLYLHNMLSLWLICLGIPQDLIICTFVTVYSTSNRKYSGPRMKDKNTLKDVNLGASILIKDSPLNWHQNSPCSLHIQCKSSQEMSAKLQSALHHQEQVFRVSVNQYRVGCVGATHRGWSGLPLWSFKPKAEFRGWTLAKSSLSSLPIHEPDPLILGAFHSVHG